MQDKLCKPGDYGPCRTCEHNVTLALYRNGARQDQEQVDKTAERIRKGVTDFQYFCEKCMEDRNSRAGDWNPDSITKMVLADANPPAVDIIIGVQSLIGWALGNESRANVKRTL